MKQLFEIFFLIIIISSSKALPHFIYDGIESFHDCSQEIEEISFSIYGNLSEEITEIMKIENYFLEDMGEFQCLLKNNENSKNKNRQHKIICSIKGYFERKGYILEEPKVSGFDFIKENGETSWPTIPESKTFLIGKCGKKIELDNEPLLTLTSNEYTNPLDTVRKEIVDKAIENLPKRTSTTLNNMCSAMKSAKQLYTLSEAESAYLVYKWLGHNIVYDCYSVNHGGIDYSGSGTYSKGKGVCAGYAHLFETMCDYLGLETEYVIGYSKGEGFKPGVIPKKSDHAWNAVKIESSYYLIDITWGAGACDGDTYIANYRDFYYCPNPETLIRTHLPEEKQWQLISQTISLETFVNMLKLEADFYINGFTSISPDVPSFSSKDEFTITITYNNTENIGLINNIYLLQGDTYYLQNNTCFYIKGEGTAETICITNYIGQYLLRIFGGPTDSERYPQLVEYTIQSTQTAETTLGFPTIYGLYSESDIHLLEPLYCPLTKGALYSFRIISNTFNNLHLIIGENHYYELDNDGKGLFTGDYAYIHGDRVALVTLNNNMYSFILQYTTANDPNSTEEPTFPTGYLAPKNVLYSPLKDTLKKGQSYLFKIKCESANDMIVVDGNNIIHLHKDGSIFSKTITINGSSGRVDLASYSKKTYTTFYYYKAS